MFQDNPCIYLSFVMLSVFKYYTPPQFSSCCLFNFNAGALSCLGILLFLFEFFYPVSLQYSSCKHVENSMDPYQMASDVVIL